MKFYKCIALSFIIALFSFNNSYAADAAKGKKLFTKCKACHNADAEKHKVGPYLVGIVGRKAASTDFTKYSKALKESGITYSLFANAFYLDMLMDFVGEQVLETKTIFVPAGDGKINFVLRNEIAEALANVLTTGGHENKTYNIGIEQPVSFGEVAKYISDITGVAINYVSPEQEEYQKKFIPFLKVWIITRKHQNNKKHQKHYPLTVNLNNNIIHFTI